MKFTANLMRNDIDARTWAQRRESEGWDRISVADHFVTNTRAYPHVWVTATAMASATTHIDITTAFVNNLFRNPVEVAQAAMTLQQVSDGRFHLGLGAGWAAAELAAAGMEYPPAGVRAGAFAESAQIIRALLHDGACHHHGNQYSIDIDGFGAPGDPPPLICSVGGPRTIAEVTPHADAVELKPASRATRAGALNLHELSQVTDDDLLDAVAAVRAVNSDIEIGMFVLCAIGDDAGTRAMVDALGDGLYSRFSGSPAAVAEGVEWLATTGVSVAQISAVDDAGYELFAREVLA
ncbi:MAG: LLM class flavin-dependent oxidoreductase [Ilumatobacteraceae bacterium]